MEKKGDKIAAVLSIYGNTKATLINTKFDGYRNWVYICSIPFVKMIKVHFKP